MPDSLDDNLLDSWRHETSVREFFDYFKIKEQKPHLTYLKDIITHFAEIPYENISKIIKLNHHWEDSQKLRSPEEVIEGHIASGLGGTCFSLTYYLQTILSNKGFICYPVMANMRAGENIHCSLIVLLDNVKYLIDPGYLLNQPMEINPEKPRLHRSEHTGVELIFDRQTDYYNLYTFSQNDAKWRYQFKDSPCPPAEFIQHWQASFLKPTMHGICLTKVTKSGLIYIHKNFMRETTFSGKRNYNIKTTYHATIHNIFHIDKQLIEQAQAALENNLAKERELGLFVPGRKVVSNR
ncbi:arylamine N-acetyltransferase [candidate division KSB1 bacterium]|nr:arylamine N-acetyltransferase [candidate division KSB1 bacterium]